jgi:hypothetical protein
MAGYQVAQILFGAYAQAMLRYVVTGDIKQHGRLALWTLYTMLVLQLIYVALTFAETYTSGGASGSRSGLSSTSAQQADPRRSFSSPARSQQRPHLQQRLRRHPAVAVLALGERHHRRARRILSRGPSGLGTFSLLSSFPPP